MSSTAVVRPKRLVTPMSAKSTIGVPHHKRALGCGVEEMGARGVGAQTDVFTDAQSLARWNADLDVPGGCLDGDDLPRAHVFEAVDLAAQRPIIGERHMLRTHTEHSLA